MNANPEIRRAMDAATEASHQADAAYARWLESGRQADMLTWFEVEQAALVAAIERKIAANRVFVERSR